MEVISLLKLLETFKTVYETKNFSEAATLLFISQPTVSAQIKQLEEEMGTLLFARNGKKKILPTPQADLLYTHALLILEDWDKTRQLIKNQPLRKETVQIAASLTFGSRLLPALLKDLLAAFPAYAFNVSVNNSREVLDMLTKHHADLGFIEMPLQTGKIKRTTLMKDTLVVAGDPAAKLWLTREASSGVYHYTKRYFEEHNIAGPFMEINSNELIVKLLQQGVGRSILSTREAQDLPTIPLPANYQRHFYLLEKDTTDSNAVDQCSRFIVQWAAQYA